MRKILFIAAGLVLFYSMNITEIFSQLTPQEINDSLVFKMNFENDSGFYALEEASGQRMGELKYGAHFSKNGLYLDGTDDELSYPKSELTRIKGRQITLSAWIKMDGTKGTHTILSKFFAYELKAINGYLQLILVVDGFKYFKAETMDTCISSNQLHHIMVTRNREEINFYVDGRHIPTKYLDPKTDTILYPANNDIYVGSAKGKECFDGTIYTVSIHKIALSQQDIATLLETTHIPNLPPTVDAGPGIICYPDIEHIALEGTANAFHIGIASESWEQISGEALTIRSDTIWRIEPGHYSFRYTATDSAGNTNSTIKTITCYDSSTAIHYLCPDGNDETGNGERNKPFKTVQRALAGFNGNYDLIINLLPGSYVIEKKIVIPEKVNLIGSGPEHTIILPDESLFNTSKTLDNSLVFIKNSRHASTIGHFTIDGQKKQFGIGLAVRNAKNLQLEHIKIVNTYYSGMALVDIESSNIHDIKLENTAWGSTDYSSGAIMIGDAENVNLYNLDISEGLVNKPESWGYGIKGFQLESSTYLKHVRIFNSQIETRNEGFWNEGEAPNISIEFHSVSFDSCEIFNVEVNNTISLAPNKYTPDSENMRLHHCKIHSPKGVPIESYMINCEIDHNYILGEYSTIKGFNNEKYSDYRVHHNIFTDQYPKQGASQAMSYGALKNVQFYNNTVYFTRFTNLTALELFAGASNGFDIANNIFYSKNPGTSKVIGLKNSATVSDVRMRNNVLYHFAVGTTPDQENNTYSEDPGFCMLSSPAYTIPVPVDSSYVIDAGVYVGLPYKGEAPDIGAGEFKTGYGMPPKLNILSPNPNSQVLPEQNILIDIIANDPDGSVDSLIVLMNGDLIRTTDQNTLSFSITPSGSGRMNLVVKAIDNEGLITTEQRDFSIVKQLNDITLSQVGPLYLPIGSDTALNVSFTPDDATNQLLNWTIDHPDVASVSPKGLVTGLNEGRTTVYAVSGNGTISTSVEVNVTGVSHTETISETGFSVFPNPAINGHIIIRQPKNITHETRSIRITDMHGRSLSCKTLPEEGKEFYLSIPVHAQPVIISILGSDSGLLHKQLIMITDSQR